MGLKPLGGRVIISEVDAEEKTEGGLFLVNAAREKKQVAEIVATGPGTKEEKMELCIGDIVIFPPYSGTEIKYNGKVYIIIQQKDILAVIQ